MVTANSLRSKKGKITDQDIENHESNNVHQHSGEGDLQGTQGLERRHQMRGPCKAEDICNGEQNI